MILSPLKLHNATVNLGLHNVIFQSCLFPCDNFKTYLLTAYAYHFISLHHTYKVLSITSLTFCVRIDKTELPDMKC